MLLLRLVPLILGTCAVAALAASGASPAPAPHVETFTHYSSGSGSWSFQGFRYLEVEKQPGPLDRIEVGLSTFGWARVIYTANFPAGVDRSVFVICGWDHGAALFDPTKQIPLTGSGALEYQLPQLEAGGGLVASSYSHGPHYGHAMVNRIDGPGDFEVNRRPFHADARWVITDPEVLESMTLQPGEAPGTTATWQIRDGGYYCLNWQPDDPDTPEVEGWSQYLLQTARHCRLAIAIHQKP